MWALSNPKQSFFSLQTWVTAWEREAWARYQYLVGTRPDYKHSEAEDNIAEFYKSYRKIFRLKCSHNLLPANKFKFDSTENPNCAEFRVKYDKFHLLMNCKKLELYQTDLKAMVNDPLQMYCDKNQSQWTWKFSSEKPFCLKE